MIPDLRLMLLDPFANVVIVVPGAMRDTETMEMPAGHMRQILARVLAAEAELALLKAQVQEADPLVTTLGHAPEASR